MLFVIIKIAPWNQNNTKSSGQSKRIRVSIGWAWNAGKPPLDQTQSDYKKSKLQVYDMTGLLRNSA